MKQVRTLSLALTLALPLLSGCAWIVGTQGDINDGAVEKTAAKDHDDRMKRMRESGNLRPEEYAALQNKIGGDSDSATSDKLSVEDLEKKVEANRRERENQGAR